MKLIELKMVNNKEVFKKINKILGTWTDLKTDYVKTGLLKFTKEIPLKNPVFTNKDVKKFRKKENYKHVNTPEELTNVSNGLRKSMLHQLNKDVAKIEDLIKNYHGIVSVFDEGERMTIQIDLGGMITL